MLSNTLRATSFDDFIGQKHIIGKDKPLYKLIKAKEIPNIIFFGTPGSGKTTLAKIIAKNIGYDYYYFNATSLKIDEIRRVNEKHRGTLLKAILFIDEIHRLNKAQQEVLLPIMEEGYSTVIGASTYNPYFVLTPAFRSRSFVYEFKPLNDDEIKEVIIKVQNYLDIKIGTSIQEHIIQYVQGDARATINLIDFGYKADKELSLKTIQELMGKKTISNQEPKELQYDLMSAMIKSIRGSDIDASLYYLARLIDIEEECQYIARRLVVLSSEDIGNANPNALTLCSSTLNAVSLIGYPEARIMLSQCVVYLASSPKSNSSYKAINKALQIVNNNILDVPQNIKNKSKTYKNPHDFNGWIKQDYLSQDIEIYKSSGIGFEKTLDEWVSKIKNEIN